MENILAHGDRVRESDCEQTQIQLLIDFSLTSG
jgi:hypothetical protein